MNNFREQYKHAANKFEISPNLIIKTARIMGNSENIKAKRKSKMLIPIIALLILSSITIFASVSNYIKYKFDKSPYAAHISSDAKDFNKKKVIKENIIITLNNISITKNVMYLSFDFETIDKTPLQVSNNNQKSTLFRQKFNESYIECNGKKYEIFVQRKDDGEIPNKATFEAEMQSTTGYENFSGEKIDLNELIGKSATLILKDLHDEVDKTEDLGFTLESLANVYSQGESCKDFVVTGKHSVYSDGTSTDSYTLPQGKYKISFSSKYPNAYIDNFGFKRSGEESGGDYFYLSITPSCEAEKKVFKKIVFKSKTTGDNWCGYGTAWGEPDDYHNNSGPNPFDPKNFKSKIKFDGDRIVIALPNIFLDKENITPKDLSDLILAIGGDTITPMLQEGSWKIPFVAEDKSVKRVFKVNQTINENYVDTITVTPLTMHITGSCNYDKDENGDFYKFRLLNKDGTEILYSLKTQGWLDEKGITFMLDTEINPNDIVGIRMWNKVINLK